MHDVYLYGMTLLSSIHKLVGAFPELDTYAEIAESYQVPGGETMNAAMVLSNLGLSTKIGGPKFGARTDAELRRYGAKYGIDMASVTTDAAYPGVMDLVLVDERHRTVFGQFERYFQHPEHRWDEPDPEGIACASIVSIDPYFGRSSERAAVLSAKAGKPYVTIDCPFDGPLHQGAAATVISGEFRKQHYPHVDEEALFSRYLESPGLTIFSAGLAEIRHGRSGRRGRGIQPFRTETVSTLGAGDVFRAGVIYGLVRSLEDGQIVSFASALAAVACRRMPIADYPPDLDAVETLLRSNA
jgi:sugar/nucleoside kinase (ribokinase family)